MRERKRSTTQKGNNLKSRVIGAALAAVAAVVVSAAPSYAVTDNCSPTTRCGRIVNSIYNDRNLTITNKIPAGAGTMMGLPIGKGSDSYTYFKDADGFYVPSGCIAYVYPWNVQRSGGVWWYINDGDNIAVTLKCGYNTG